MDVITSELREYIKQGDLLFNNLGVVCKALTEIADRIDAEHERALEALYRDMSDTEYIELPKDADKKPLATSVAHINHPQVPLCVLAMTYSVEDGHWKVLTREEDGLRRYESYSAYELRAYTPPTVEDVLREFAEEYAHDEMGVEQYLLDKYAAKLQLRGDAE